MHDTHERRGHDFEIVAFDAGAADAAEEQRVAREVTALHAAYYCGEWQFGARFAQEVESDLAEFLQRFDPVRDRLWFARAGGETVGAVAIDGGRDRRADPRLRWFILDPRMQGRGAGRQLIARALEFCRSSGAARVHLWTFAGLEKARRLYDRAGFVLVEETADDAWGRRVTHQRFELELADCGRG